MFLSRDCGQGMLEMSATVYTNQKSIITQPMAQKKEIICSPWRVSSAQSGTRGRAHHVDAIRAPDHHQAIIVALQ
jgi:hypothetical protein